MRRAPLWGITPIATLERSVVYCSSGLIISGRLCQCRLLGFTHIQGARVAAAAAVLDHLPRPGGLSRGHLPRPGGLSRGHLPRQRSRPGFTRLPAGFTVVRPGVRYGPRLRVTKALAATHPVTGPASLASAESLSPRIGQRPGWTGPCSLSAALARQGRIPGLASAWLHSLAACLAQPVCRRGLASPLWVGPRPSGRGETRGQTKLEYFIRN